MQTSVTRIGRTVPHEFRGAVRAVWRRAMAVDVCATAARPRIRPAIVTLVREDVPMTAASMALQTSAEFGGLGVSAGEIVEFDGITLVVGSAATASQAIVADARAATYYEGTLPRVGRTVDLSELEPIAQAALDRREGASGYGSLARASSARCDALLADLALGATFGDGGVATRAARSLLGLGPGLTPSGDDALCGFVLGRRLAGSAGGADDAVRRVALSASGLTTDLSSIQLALAADGRFGEALLAVAVALGAGGLRGVRASVAACLEQGATSGADGLLGLVAGVRSAKQMQLAVNAS